MKKILFIAPASFPVTGAENIVNMKLLQALSKSEDFKIDLVSKKSKWENYPSEPISAYDVRLESLNIVEVDNQVNIKTCIEHILAFFYFGVTFKGAHWAVKALPVVKKLFAQNQYDYVLTKDSSSLLLGYYLRKKKGIKWVATWNDPYPESKYPKPYGKGWQCRNSFSDNRLIKIMRKWVDIHVFPSDRIKAYMNNYLCLSPDKMIIIPHVVLNLKQTLNTPPCDVLRIIHSGNLKYPRNPLLLIKSLALLLKKHPTFKIEVVFMGVLDNEMYDLIIQYGLTGIIKITPPVSYENSLLLLSQYHLAVVIEAPCEEGIFLPTKVSDFMQCHKHIWAISPKVGVLNDLYNSGKISYYSDNTDFDSVYKELCRICEDFQTDTLGKPIPLVENYTEKYVVDKYKIL